MASRSIACVLMLACLSAVCARAGSVADLDADNGLPNAKLTAPLTSFTGLTKTDDAGRWLSFTRSSDKLDFNGVPLKGITYNFFKGLLYSIDLDVEGKRNVGRMLKTLEERYGRQHTLDTKNYRNTEAVVEVREWAGTKAYCDFKSAGDRSGGQVVFVDKPTWDLLQKPKEEQAAQARMLLKGSFTNGDF
jgi:hypothetical protein